jgi:uncharacterized membrane protein YqjE
MSTARDSKGDIADRLRETVEDLVELVTAQLRLTRMELQGDARAVGGRVARLAIYVPLLVLGYGFLAAAGAWALAARIGLPWALAAVGTIHVIAGGWGVARVARSFRQIRVLDRSHDELERSLQRVAPAVTGTPPELR